MTIQNLFVAELADILHIQLECECGAQLSLKPDAHTRLPEVCPQHCGREWKKGALDSRVVADFLKIVAEARRQQSANDTVKIKLVFDHEPVQS